MRRMIDPQTIIKSQVINDKEAVDLHELLEKYGTENDFGDIKSVTLQVYLQEIADDGLPTISAGQTSKGVVAINTAMTISKYVDGNVFIGGLIFDNSLTNFLGYTIINDGDYENGIMLFSNYSFDIHVIKV